MLRIVGLLSACFLCSSLFAQSHSFTYLDEYCEPYYPGTDFPKLTTPQWIGEAGVDAVVTLAIDDMRDTAKYEAYLRPILDRLKQIDGRTGQHHDLPRRSARSATANLAGGGSDDRSAYGRSPLPMSAGK